LAASAISDAAPAAPVPLSDLALAKARIAEFERNIRKQQMDLDFSAKLPAHRRAGQKGQHPLRRRTPRRLPAQPPIRLAQTASKKQRCRPAFR
jgi:hypothetical protein